MMMMIIILLLLEWAAADGKTFCFFAGRLSSLLRLPLAARFFFFFFFVTPTYYLELSIWTGDRVWSRAELWMLMEVLLKLTVWSFMILAQGRTGYGGL